MAEIASLGLEIRSDSVKDANVQLRAMTTTASAAEKAAQKWGLSLDKAGQSSEAFSRRVQNTIRSLEFERQQLTRSAAEQERYTALRRAGVAADSQAGRAISASVAALQAQRSALDGNAKSFTLVGVAVQRLAAAYGAAFVARKIFEAASKAANLGEEAEQVGATVEGLQALRYQAVQNNVSVENLDTALAKFSRTLGEAGQGNKDAIESFQRLGVNILDGSRQMRPMQDNLVDVARAIVAIKDPSARAAAAVDVFGKSGQRMLPLLGQIAGGFDELQQKSAKAIVPQEVAENLDRFGDRAATVWQEQTANLARIGAVAVDAFNWLDDLNKSIPSNQMLFEDLWDSIRDGLETVKRAGAVALAGLGEMFAQLGGVIKNAFINGMNAAIEAVETGINRITAALADSWLGQQLGIGGTVNLGRIGGGGPIATSAERVAAITAAQEAAGATTGMTYAEQRKSMRYADARRAASDAGAPAGPLTATTGAGLPAVKGSGSGASDPYKKAIESAREYVLAKQAETAALGLNVEAAAKLKHEQELLNKAQNDGKTVSAAQKAEIAGLAAEMAKADAAFAGAKFMNDATKKSEEFVAQQQIERDMLFMSAEAATAYRIEQEYLTAAKQQGLILTQQEIDKLRELAGVMAKQKAQTDQLRDALDFGREVFKGFFSDMREGLMQGQTLWESFGHAAVNVLNRIAEKLIELAATQVWDSLIAPKGGGGLVGAIMGLLGIGGGAPASFGSMLSSGLPELGPIALAVARGAAFDAGNVIPFARGGLVDRPTLFPMARGMGLMGEAGEEGVFPLRRTRNGDLGVQAVGGQPQRTVVEIHLVDDMLDARIADGADVRIVRAAPTIEGRAVKRAGEQAPARMAAYHNQRSPDWRAA